MVKVALISSSGKTSWLKRRRWPTLLKTMEYPLKSVTYVSRLFCNLCVRLYRAIFNRRALTDVAIFFALPEVMLTPFTFTIIVYSLFSLQGDYRMSHIFLFTWIQQSMSLSSFTSILFFKAA